MFGNNELKREVESKSMMKSSSKVGIELERWKISCISVVLLLYTE